MNAHEPNLRCPYEGAMRHVLPERLHGHVEFLTTLSHHHGVEKVVEAAETALADMNKSIRRSPLRRYHADDFEDRVRAILYPKVVKQEEHIGGYRK